MTGASSTAAGGSNSNSAVVGTVAFDNALVVQYGKKADAQQFAQDVGVVFGGTVKVGDVKDAKGRPGEHVVRVAMKRPDLKAKRLLPEGVRKGTLGSPSSSSAVPFVTWDYLRIPMDTFAVTVNNKQFGSTQLARDGCLWLAVMLFLQVPPSSWPENNSAWEVLKAAAAAAAGYYRGQWLDAA
jgi:hypothetical protein